MRVRINYAVDWEELPDEVHRLMKRASSYAESIKTDVTNTEIDIYSLLERHLMRCLFSKVCATLALLQQYRKNIPISVFFEQWRFDLSI